MNILVINGSPKGENSDTIKLTRAFLAGVGEPFEEIALKDEDIRPCAGCFGCWFHTPGRCWQQDGAAAILDKIFSADLCVWSFPLYCYGMPSQTKALIDRLLPRNSPAQYVGEDGRTHHPLREGHAVKMMLISGSGFPDREGNFDGLIFQFERLFGKCPMILCVESPLLNIEEAAPVAQPYLDAARRAGVEYKQTGAISAQTQAILDAPMFPPDDYRRQSGG